MSSSAFTRKVTVSSRWTTFVLLILIAGLLIQVFLGLRSSVGGDQTHLLALALRFIETGHLEPFAKMMRGAGNNGALLQILIGVPLMIVHDHRAPLMMIGLFDLAAFLLLAYVVRRGLGDGASIVYLLIFWLSPWRLYHSAFLWEPQFLFLPAALHLFACWNCREKPSFLSCAGIGFSVLLAFQIHNSALVLALMTLALMLSRSIRINWAGLIAGSLVAGLPLVLTVVALAQGTIPAAEPLEGYIGRGFVHVAPVLKGLLYWVRLGSLDIGNPLAQTVFIEEGIAAHGAATVTARAAQAVGIATIAASAIASWWYLVPLWRRWRAGRRNRPENESADRARSGGWRWLRRYALAAGVALVISAGLSPITLQGWMVIIALHAAVLPVACWLYDEVGIQHRPVVLASIIAAQLLVIAVVGMGNRIFLPRQIEQQYLRKYPELERFFAPDSGRTSATDFSPTESSSEARR